MITRSQRLTSARVDAVQAPVIPIVAGWIRETPGTISLGQGVVSYGPPPEALASLAAFGGHLSDHRYGPVEGTPALVARLTRKLREENGIDTARGCRVVVVNPYLEPGLERYWVPSNAESALFGTKICDLHVPVRPGGDVALANATLKLLGPTANAPEESR